MKKLLFTLVLMFLFVAVHAQSTETPNIETQIDQKQEILELIETKVLETLAVVEGKVVDETIKTQVADTQEEITSLIEIQQEKLEEASSEEQITDIMTETKQTIILKTYDALTDQDLLTETVKVPGGEHEQAQAVDAVLDTMQDDERITLQIKTEETIQQVLDTLQTYDVTARASLLFRDDDTLYLEISVSKNGLVAKELLGTLDEGIVPEKLLRRLLVKPEVYTIGQLSLAGERSTELRGPALRQSARYTSSLSNYPKIRVAVIDTGIDPNHPDLKDAISKTTLGYDFVNNDNDPMDDHLHGTHVAGTIAAAINSGGVYGINPTVELVALKICTAQGYCPSYAITNAIKYAADKGIEVLNMSLGGLGVTTNNASCAAIDYAVSKGSLPIVAAGNANSPVTSSIPGACINTITVGAVDPSLQRASFSNYGSKVDISAPGVGILSTIPGGQWKQLDGTSMATPHISAAVAAIRAAKGPQTLAQIRQRLLGSTKPASYETGKYIGPILDYPVLMTKLGIVPQDVSCMTGCATTGVTTTISPSLTIGSGITVQSLGTPTVLYKDGLKISRSFIVMSVGDIWDITVEGSSVGYDFLESETILSFGYYPTTTRISKNPYNYSSSVTIIARKPGIGSIQIKDKATGKIISIPVYVFPKVYTVKVGNEFNIYPSSFNLYGLIAGSTTSGSCLLQNVGSSYYPYTLRAKKTGLCTLTIPAYHKVRSETNTVLEYMVEVTADPFVANLQSLQLGVGEMTTLRVSGGTPPYSINKGGSALSYYRGQGNGLQVASAGTSDEPMVVIEDDLSLTGELGLQTLGEEIVEQQTGFCEDCDSISGSLFTPTQVEQETIEVANLSTPTEVGIRAMIPGSTTMTVTDAEGRKLSIPVTVTQKEMSLALSNQMAWYYRDYNNNFEIKNVTSSQPSILKINYNSRNRYAVPQANGYAMLTFDIYNLYTYRTEQMIVRVRAGNPSTLSMTATATGVQVGQIATVTVQGGMGPYTLTKNNEKLGLGKANLSMTTIASTDPSKLVSWSKGTTLAPVAMSGVLLTTGIVNASGVLLDGWTGEWETILEEKSPGVQIASTTSGNSQSFQIVGLQPGETILTVKDAAGQETRMTITIHPTRLTLESAYIGGRFRAPINVNKAQYFQLRSPIYQGLFRASAQWRQLKTLTTSNPKVVSYITRHHYRTYYLIGVANGIATVTATIYNPDEGKQQTMEYEVATTGMTPETLQALLAQYEKDNISDGPVSSINPGGGGFPSTSTSPIMTKTPEQRIAEDKTQIIAPTTSYTMNAGQMTVIDVVREKSNDLTLQYDPSAVIVHKYTGPGKLQMATQIASTGDDRWGADAYEVISGDTAMTLQANGVASVEVLYEQYIVYGKPGSHQVKFSSKYGKVITTDIYYADKVYTIPKGVTRTSKINGLPFISAYEDDSSIVDNRVFFEFKDSSGRPTASSSKDSLSIQGKNYGRTTLHREFDTSYGLVANNKLKVLDIKVDVPDPNAPQITRSKKRSDIKNNPYYGGEVWEPSIALPTSFTEYKKLIEKKLQETYVGWEISWQNQTIGGYVVCYKYKVTGMLCNTVAGNTLLSENSSKAWDQVNWGSYSLETNAFNPSSEAIQYLYQEVSNRLIEQNMELKSGSLVVFDMYKQTASLNYFSKIAELAYHMKNSIKTVLNTIDFPALFVYFQENLPSLAQSIAIGMREDMKQNPIRFALDFTVVGDLISIVEYIQGFDMMSELQKYVNASVIGFGLMLNTSKSGDDAFKKVVNEFYTVEDYFKRVNRDNVITHGMVDTKKHYKKHGIKEFLDRGLEPVSAQQYFDDAKNFFHNINLNDSKYTVEFRNTVLGNGKRVKDSTTGRGGIISDAGGVVTFFYF